MAADNRKEIEQLLKIKIEELGELDVLEDVHGDDFTVEEMPEVPARQKDQFRSFIKSVPRGKEGYEALANSRIVEKLEAEFAPEELDKHKKRPFQEAFSQLSWQERTNRQRRHVLLEYKRTLKRVEAIYRILSSGGSINPHTLEEIVEPFLTILETDRAVVQNLSTFVYSEKDYLFNHIIRVCLLSINIAAASGFSRAQVGEIGQAAMLADIGMTLVDEKIRIKRGRLTEEERYEMQKHPILGLHCLEKVPELPASVAYAAYQHHERLSGAGYPKNRKGRLIHDYAKIVAIADVFEALCSERTYRMALNPNEAIKKIVKMGSMNLLDSGFIKNFVRYYSAYPVGTLVRLSDSRVGKVVQSNEEDVTRPFVFCITDSSGRFVPHKETVVLDLLHDRTIKIKYALDPHPLSEDILTGF